MNLSKTILADRAKISKAAVSQWFRKGKRTGWVNVESQTLKQLAEGMGVSPSVFLEERADLSRFQTEFLWDFLYPDMERFVEALIDGRPEALARLVQVSGFANGRKVAGSKVIGRFPSYKKFIKPVRRTQLEILWPLYRGDRPFSTK